MKKLKPGKSIVFLLLLLAVGIMGCTASEEEKGPKILFEDDFEGNALDDSKWERCPEWTRGGGMDLWDEDMSYLDGEGLLILRAEWDEENERVLSGAVRTYDHFSAGFGYYEASIRFPVAKGIWGAFWMMVGDVHNVDGTSIDGVEIDIIESISNESGYSNHALHWDGYETGAKSASKTHADLDIYDGEFHAFALWRTEESYIFYVDGQETWRSEGGGICAEDGYVKLTVEAASWAGAGTRSSINALPAQMEVDYVRVWDTNPYITEDVEE